MGGQPLVDGEDGAIVAAGDGALEPAGKRRRKAFLFDEVCEIPKEVYQGYMQDRSKITKKEDQMYDSSILIPHNHPMMPEFTTTYTDMCPALIQCLSWGSQVADRRRAVLAMAEAANLDNLAKSGAFAEPAVPSDLVPADIVMAEPDGAVVEAPDDARWEPSVVHLDLTDAPGEMNQVITSGQAEQDDSQVAEAARVGYSGRTEKMHKFLAKEFQRSSSSSAAAQPDLANLSYEDMCKTQAGGDRGVIAGCFFELLVLRTNGVVNLRQDKPYSDVRIEKAKAWGTTSS